jgi:hypothetical protein
LTVRLSIGRLLGWDRAPVATACETFATRMTTVDCAKTLVPTGAPERLFRVVYRFENEQLLELINRTAHAAALSALVETASVYRFYFAVYVRNVSRFTPLYVSRQKGGPPRMGVRQASGSRNKSEQARDTVNIKTIAIVSDNLYSNFSPPPPSFTSLANLSAIIPFTASS